MELDEMVILAKKFNLTLSQIGFMLYLEEGRVFPCDIDKLEKSDLYVRKLIVNNATGPSWTGVYDKPATIKTIVFTFNEELVKVLELMSICLRDPDVGEATQKKIKEEFPNNDALASLFITWYCLFPTEGRRNAGWNTLYGVTYTGVTLRIFTPRLSMFFKKLARDKTIDMSVFVFATYWFIRAQIRNGKTWIPKISKFLDSWEDWYESTEEIVRDKNFEQIAAMFNLDEGVTTPERELQDKTVTQIGMIMD
jgi:hypothetical protein